MALVRTGERLLACIDQALRHHRLSRAGREALAVLDGAGQSLSPTAIAERLIVTTASVTSVGWSNAGPTPPTDEGCSS